MPQHVILTAIGTDRPGLVDEVSQFIFERAGNIEDSRMVNLRGQFAMMVLVGGSEQTLARLRGELWQLQQSSGLQTDLRPAAASQMPASAHAVPYRMKGTTLDQPGLVHRLSHTLREAGVNIESLDTRLTPAPITGSPMFEMTLEISIPASTSISKLRERLAIVCDELNIDWQLTPIRD